VRDYEEFIESKRGSLVDVGFEPGDLPAFLYPFQMELVREACLRGRSAIFAECGLGKTGMQLAWAEQVARETGKPVLILAPLAVSQQTVSEGVKFGIPVVYRQRGSDIADLDTVVITNYERLKDFDPKLFGGVVLDESGILKAYSGVTKRLIIETFKSTPYRLACSATPAPNDTQELGNHSEFLSVLNSHEMVARWFLTTFDAGKFRLKGHAIEPFWRWVVSWSSMCRLPSDVGNFSDDGFVLPELKLTPIVVQVDMVSDRGELLFRDPGLSATMIHAERRRTVDARVAAVVELVKKEPNESWVIWTETDYEGDALELALPESGNLRGSLSVEKKEELLRRFAEGELKVLIAKPKIAGFGLNWQHCARMAFVAATYSFEAYYQAVRRCWRFGQKREVHCYMVSGTTEAHVIDVLNEKREEFERMHAEMMRASHGARTNKQVGAVRYTGTKKSSVGSWIKGK
jgi:superfamily II DNA or RNA helicase